MFRGIILLTASELVFVLATVFAKYAVLNSNVSTLEIVFLRFILGLFFALSIILIEKRSFRPHNWSLVFQRGIYNTIAVLLFYLAVQYTTITNANMLNMTYPVFIFIIAPFIHPEKAHPGLIICLIMTMLGIYLVINPNFHQLNIGDILGLVSGLVSALAITTLRKAREYDSTSIILFYLMVTGSIVSFFVMLPVFKMPNGMTALYAFLSAVCGILGQLFITMGFRHITAKAGSLISASGIIFAPLFGIILFNDPLNPSILGGGLLILTSVIFVALFQTNGLKEKIENLYRDMILSRR